MYFDKEQDLLDLWLLWQRRNKKKGDNTYENYERTPCRCYDVGK